MGLQHIAAISRRLLALIGILAITFNSGAPVLAQEPQTLSDWSETMCTADGFSVDFNIPSAGLHQCRVAEDGVLEISIAPESEPPINCSAWYAFRVTPTSADEANVRLKYKACRHRYRPKVSGDFQTWTELAEDNVSTSIDRQTTTLALNLSDAQVFVAAQEVLPVETYDLWLGQLAQAPDIRRVNLGTSIEGRLIDGLLIGNPDATKLTVLIGRQHAPEVTGALAMFPFVWTVASDHKVASAYREDVLTLVVPLINPDGVANGHWRHNMDDTDLNRDWKPFAQPETRAVHDYIQKLVVEDGKALQILIDFHSTTRDVFYTIPDDMDTDPLDYSGAWLDRLEARLPEFAVNRDPGHNPDRAVSKAYAYEVYNVASVTFEIGDNTNRDLITPIGQHSALALMEVLTGKD